MSSARQRIGFVFSEPRHVELILHTDWHAVHLRPQLGIPDILALTTTPSELRLDVDGQRERM